MAADDRKEKIAEVVEEIVQHAPKKDVGFLVKCIGIGLFFICLGVCLAFVMYGGFFVNTESSKDALKEPDTGGKNTTFVVEQKSNGGGNSKITVAGAAGTTVTLHKE